MICGPGAEMLECVAFTFPPETLARDLTEFLNRVQLHVIVNGRTIAQRSMWSAEWRPGRPTAGALVFTILYRVKEGDRITAELRSFDGLPDYTFADGITPSERNSAFSIGAARGTGELDESRLRDIGGGCHSLRIGPSIQAADLSSDAESPHATSA